MFDATAKPPSGILSGNVVQYGDFDECLSVENAQYCLAEIDFRNVWKEPYLKFQNQVHSYFVFKEEFNDVSISVVQIKRTLKLTYASSFFQFIQFFLIRISCSSLLIKN